MTHNDMHHKANMAGIVVASAAIGAAVAMLVTPKSGHEIREKIAKKAQKAKDEHEDMPSDMPTPMP